MEYVINVPRCLQADGEVLDVALRETKTPLLLRSDSVPDGLEVCGATGGIIIKTDDALVELKQGFKQIGADESGDASDEPCFGALLQLLACELVSVHREGFSLSEVR